MTNRTAALTVGTRVAVNDPSWHRHGAEGTVVKVNRKTIRVRLDGEPTDTIGAPIYFIAI